MIYPWQQTQWQEILTRYRQGRLPHALLLTGSPGLGKFDFAKAVAEFLLCEAQDGGVCGSCRGCQLFRAGNHPDFFKLIPEERNKNIKIAQIRELINALNQTAQNGDYQVVIIYPVEAMNRTAANAFLKTLEEPCGQIFLILISHQPGALLPTILSRCQRLAFTASANEPTVQWLQKQIDGDRREAIQLLTAAFYAPLQALQLKLLNYTEVRDRLLQLIVNITAKRENAVSVAGTLLKEDLTFVLQVLIIIVMDLLRLQLKATNFVVNSDQLTLLQELSATLPKNKIMLLLQELQEAWRLTKNSLSVNTQLLLEDLFLIL
ncbi:DNA polymerase III subunit delta' [Coxiella endosymbiont of Ornithodoros amblus]|uniref:DNA polymerase III subunit delta' n=1 Tax=Coxiella endosymbiont of Ornithodoros amblus TaxID=1656166 RepID=UPI00244E0442|nr:DNA polymerase III subunit delta' [Coxiella endosymbiont of Ornithodoros amblus]MBW5802711.1 DNA polymerase III subunit delta' [Coxiella endosymbiont of Ornithodoros amblus]